MAITIRHTHNTKVHITYYTPYDERNFYQDMMGSMDKIAEYVACTLTCHNWAYADVEDSLTGEVLMIIERS